ncbi:hypothetical protein MHYP_G00274130 [Metynnis hypsauchen]
MLSAAPQRSGGSILWERVWEPIRGGMCESQSEQRRGSPRWAEHKVTHRSRGTEEGLENRHKAGRPLWFSGCREGAGLVPAPSGMSNSPLKTSLLASLSLTLDL